MKGVNRFYPQLSLYSPAETLMILLGTEAPFSELIKITLMDLILKQVLTIENVPRQPNPADRLRIFKYVLKGQSYPGYAPLKHEKIYMDYFSDSTSNKILFRTLIKAGYNSVHTSGLYRNMIISNKLMQENFVQYFYEKPFGLFRLNKKGKSLKTKLVEELSAAKAELMENFLENPERAAEIVKSIGGNLFLFHEFDFTLFEEFDKDLLMEMEQNKSLLSEYLGSKYGWETSGNF